MPESQSLSPRFDFIFGASRLMPMHLHININLSHRDNGFLSCSAAQHSELKIAIADPLYSKISRATSLYATTDLFQCLGHDDIVEGMLWHMLVNGMQLSRTVLEHACLYHQQGHARTYGRPGNRAQSTKSDDSYDSL